MSPRNFWLMLADERRALFARGRRAAVRGRVVICNQRRAARPRRGDNSSSSLSNSKPESRSQRGQASVSGRSIMGLMMLAAGPGTEIELAATGPDAERAVDALAGS